MLTPHVRGGLHCGLRWELVVQRLCMDDGSYMKTGRRKMMVATVDVQLLLFLIM